MKALFIDGHNLLFKSYAVPFTFRSQKGTQLQVVSTFLSLLRRALRVTGADTISVVFDADTATDNHVLYEEYKSNRNYDYSDVEMSPFEHLPLIKAALDTVSLSWIEMPGHEADDVIATFNRLFLEEATENKTYITSTDTDFYQLLSERCNILKLLPKGKHQFLDPEHVHKTYAISPEQYVTLKAWVGDKADNITGIDGIGWKRGAEIIHGTRTRPLTPEEEKILERNHRLITLNDSVPVSLASSLPEKLMKTNNNDIFALCDF